MLLPHPKTADCTMWGEAQPPRFLSQGLQCSAQFSLRAQIGSLSCLETLVEPPSKALLTL